MGVINDNLKPINDYLLKIGKNTVNDSYELEIGIDSKWEYNENKSINCEILSENDKFKILKIYPNKQNITIDDLIDFVKIIISVNEEINKMEEKFNREIEKSKSSLEGMIKDYMGNIEDFKKKAFESMKTKSKKESTTKKSTDNKINDEKVEDALSN